MRPFLRLSLTILVVSTPTMFFPELLLFPRHRIECRFSIVTNVGPLQPVLVRIQPPRRRMDRQMECNPRRMDIIIRMETTLRLVKDPLGLI
ncbi:hypothetical protein F5878DRAFT_614934, partial [Lentinula raphanica]